MGDLYDRDDRRAGALRDRDGVADVVDVTVRQQDRLRLELVGGDGRLRVARQERVDEHGRDAVAELERGVAEVADLHVVAAPVGS